MTLTIFSIQVNPRTYNVEVITYCLIRLIEQTPDIRKRFKTEYISFGKPAGKPAIQTTYQTIHNDEKYLLWKAEIEAELEKLPESKIVQDIIHFFQKWGKTLVMI